METLREEREEECNAAGLEEACTDRFDDQIEGEQQAMEEELDSMRLEQEAALQNINTNRTGQVEELEMEREERLDALREEWRVSCTDQCTVCRETKEELLEADHLEYEEKITNARIHWDEQVRITETDWKDTMDLVRGRRQAEIDR